MSWGATSSVSSEMRNFRTAERAKRFARAALTSQAGETGETGFAQAVSAKLFSARAVKANHLLAAVWLTATVAAMSDADACDYKKVDMIMQQEQLVAGVTTKKVTTKAIAAAVEATHWLI